MENDTLEDYQIDGALSVNVQLLLMLLLVSSLVGFCTGCFCLTRRDTDKMPTAFSACWGPEGKPPKFDNEQTNV
ncbi:Oidioi.mRNA.OKI2018_I69.chr2.g6100.t1.cds [Oikopleura dioica]|uniref:Oidioi.mRNA.OKI2018_I69.chr2.g6100.t1.cds n=1 Tax=Oikopleura dioica TaxID=34765 RepID=A0ABN7T1Z4_OIKDI|nr:Oidioi.mRNA.OKI2018_I69.chr2.g6100.t1.cds [Oikopleura dioica]